MKLLIDIPEKYYEACKDAVEEPYPSQIEEVIANGIPYNPSGDCISREDLKKTINDIVDQEIKEDRKWAMGLRYSLKLIDNAPTVEAYTGTDLIEENKKGFNTAKRLYERPQGEWIDYNAYYKTCSICKRTVGIDFLIQKYEDKPEEYSFCPNCGAKMKGGAE